MNFSALKIYLCSLIKDFPGFAPAADNILHLVIDKKIILVTGGRSYKNKELVYRTLSSMEIDAIVHGGASGADSFAGQWAIENGVPEIIVPAQWKKYHLNAGPERNSWMIKFIPVFQVVAFPGGRGTANMVSLAKRANIQVLEIHG